MKNLHDEAGSRPEDVHPAQYSKQILEVFKDLLQANPTDHVHDPCCGPGVRLGALCTEMGLSFSGTDIEACFVVDPRCKQGNATKPSSYPKRTKRRQSMTIACSFVYPNGMAEEWAAKDKSSRKTYRSAKKDILGKDEPLETGNAGSLGYRGRSLNAQRRHDFWILHNQIVSQWGAFDQALVNVSDFKSGDVTEPVVMPTMVLLIAHGFKNLKVYEVETKRMRFGSNRDARADSEAVIHAWR